MESAESYYSATQSGTTHLSQSDLEALIKLLFETRRLADQEIFAVVRSLHRLLGKTKAHSQSMEAIEERISGAGEGDSRRPSLKETLHNRVGEAQTLAGSLEDVASLLEAHNEQASAVERSLEQIAHLGSTLEALTLRLQTVSKRVADEVDRLGPRDCGLVEAVQELRSLNEHVQETASAVQSGVGALRHPLSDLARERRDAHGTIGLVSEFFRNIAQEDQLLCAMLVDVLQASARDQRSQTSELQDTTHQILSRLQFQDRIDQILAGLMDFLQGDRRGLEMANGASGYALGENIGVYAEKDNQDAEDTFDFADPDEEDLVFF